MVNVPPFSIDEFRVMSPTYDAEFGRTAGSQISVITRSGGNAFHGDVYEFLRNSALDARNFFDPAGPIPAFLYMEPFLRQLFDLGTLQCSSQ